MVKKPTKAWKPVIFLMTVAVTMSFARTEKAYAADAAKVTVGFEHSEGSNCKKLSDGSGADGPTSKSYVAFAKGQSLKVSSEVPLGGLYIKWSAACLPGEWTLECGDTSITCGSNGFLHEYVELPKGTLSCRLYFPNKEAGIVEMEAYGEGDVPADVQRWLPPCKEADLLILSTHADDEVLFLGGVCVLYAGQEKLKTQVAYMCDFTLNDYGYRSVTREHEKLDGLWEMGIRNYPVNGRFPDAYSTTLEKALTQYDYNEVVRFVTENIRRFKPLILVSQDFNGEYGHGGHRLFAKAAAEALGKSSDDMFLTDSADKYGTWDVSKAYYHLYPENKMRLDVRTPLSEFGGRNSLEVQNAAFKKHVTQQDTWFYVSDEYPKFDCAAFGLYRSAVGADSEGNSDMTENIVTYEDRYETMIMRAVKTAKKLFLGHIFIEEQCDE